MTLPTDIVRVTVQELQKRFNEGNYWGRLKNGEYTALVREDRHPSLVAAHEPYCTRSQIVSYVDQDNNEIARVHQYLRLDGTLGASGKPDPKRLLEGGVVYAATAAKSQAAGSTGGPAKP
jgi:hypothetical protein